MLIRPYQPSDLEEIKRIHAASKLDYSLPNLDSPLFLSKVVVERDGKPTTLLAGRLEVETYLLTSGSAEERLGDIEAAQPEFLHNLWLQGIDSAYCVVPKSVDRHFGKHMERLGWARARKDWYPWTRNTE